VSTSKPKRAESAKRERPLTERARRFVEAYAASGNATHAARVAGYAGDDRTLSVAGAKLVANPKVASAIAELGRQRTRANIATREERLELLTSIARGDMHAPIGIRDGRVIFGPPTHDARRKAAMDIARMNGELLDAAKPTVDVNVNTRSVHVVLMVPPSKLGPQPSSPAPIEANASTDDPEAKAS